MGGEDADAWKLAKVVEHPVRSRIIELLGERGSLGWKELSSELGVKTGSLYHHLDALEGLVERDAQKKYLLTKSGKIVYSRTSRSRSFEAVQKAASEIRKEGASRRQGVAIFVPRSLISSLTSSRAISAAVVAVFGSSFAIFSWAERTSPVLYYLRADPGLLLTIGGFIASAIGVYLLAYVSGRLFLKSNVDPFVLAASSVISFLPVFGVSVLTLVPSISAFLLTSNALYTILLVGAQAWSSTILGAGLSVATGVRIERTLLVSLVLLYITMMAMLLQGPRV